MLAYAQEGEVLVRVYAAGVNPADWKLRSGRMKDFRPSTFPYVPGADLAGVVAKVGTGVTAFQPGQAVFGRSSKRIIHRVQYSSGKCSSAETKNAEF